MKRGLLFVFCLLLVACGSDEEIKEDTVMEDKEEVVEAPAGLDSSIQKLIDKSSKVKNYEYSHREGLFFTHVWTEGFLMKQKEFKESDDYVPGKQIDTVYLDTFKRTIKAYCEEEYCNDPNEALDTNYEDFVIVTPLDELALIKDNAQVIGSEKIDGKESSIIQYRNDRGEDVRLTLWTFYGIPLKKELLINGVSQTQILYQNLEVNTLSSSDVQK